MLYYVKRGDTLQKIAIQFNTTPKAIMEANVICNPNFISAGEPLIIPNPNIKLPKSQGQPPYYIVKFGDTYLCLSKEFNIPVKSLIYMNKFNPTSIPTGSEILVGDYMGSPIDLKEQWETIGNTKCDKLTEDEIYNVYYNGSFIWQTLGNQSIPYLLDLLKHNCDIVRFYSIVSLGRIAPNNLNVINTLINMTSDKSELVSTAAQLALDRITLVEQYGKRMHITVVENRIYDEPNLKANSFLVPIGNTVMSLNWAIPSITGEKNMTGDVILYDRVRFFSTGQDGYMPRLGFNEINVI
ncbi:LysM peptidoglycan-binding domain-containing protein [Tepidibacter formicigenes]|uniref:LysM domain-containing protein n=1 Tax=Tepidibacter formicigenes DSM 15518 TaxID=1123349 RepID=A0A1M6L9Y9_9FIRM|nr:LysM peptidoglycan-binding domain-containing protein [Tepidibacter formicigenes]SHJ68017.1 LysM domain-containing protein [Tepidibacter formicigenes DSM 15518]